MAPTFDTFSMDVRDRASGDKIQELIEEMDFRVADIKNKYVDLYTGVKSAEELERANSKFPLYIRTTGSVTSEDDRNVSITPRYLSIIPTEEEDELVRVVFLSEVDRLMSDYEWHCVGDKVPTVYNCMGNENAFKEILENMDYCGSQYIEVIDEFRNKVYIVKTEVDFPKDHIVVKALEQLR